jgi:sulfate-transporting ATPase
LARIVATLGVTAAVDQGAKQRYGTLSRNVHGFFPTHGLRLGPAVVSEDRIWILGVATALTLGLWSVYKFTTFGAATTGLAENPRAVATLGWSPFRLAALNWTIGGALSGLAGVLLAPIIGFSADGFSLLIVPALAVAVLAGFRSFPLALLGGIAIGVLESETVLVQANHPTSLLGFFPTVGLDSVVPFAVILAVLYFRGRPLPLRGETSDRLPRLGQGRPRWNAIGIAFAVACASVFLFGNAWTAALTLSATVAVIALSVVVITGYAGQLSLAQYGLAGVGALISSRLADAGGLPFTAAAPIGVVAAVLVGFVVALPAARVRGVNLAVVTMSLAVVINDAVLANTSWNGGAVRGTVLPTPSFFGLDVGTVAHPGRWAVLCLVTLLVATLAVSNLRRSRSGRRLIAVRDNERAAASLGVNITMAKLFAFGLGSGLAGLGGVLLAFANRNVQFDQYSPLQSIQIVLLAVIGGIGFITGSIIAGIGTVAGVAQELLNHLWSVAGWFGFILAVLFLVAIVVHPDGAADRFSTLFARVPVPRRRTKPAPSAQLITYASKVTPKALEVRELSVHFNGVVALDNVSFTVRPGTTLGLIGPNGAGKTTLVDAVCGFLPSYSGAVLVDGQSIDGLRASRRARTGVSRSFQSLELFEDLSILDNLRIAADQGRPTDYVADLLHPRNQGLPSTAVEAVKEFGLTHLLDRRPGELSYAQRRSAAIVRAVASAPSVLLLDEPAAGLDPSGRQELERLIGVLAQTWQMAVILIEHDVGMVMRTCDEVVALSFGSVIARGTPQQVRANPQVVQAYLGAAVDRHAVEVTAE